LARCSADGSRHVEIPILQTSFNIFHNLLFSICTDLINPHDVDEYNGLRQVMRVPDLCDLEDLFCLTDQYGLVTLRDRIRDYLGKFSSGRTLIRRLFGPVSRKFPDLRDVYFQKFKRDWSTLKRNGEFIAAIDEIDESAREEAMRYMAEAMIEMQFK